MRSALGIRSALVHREMLDLERAVAHAHPFRPRVLGGPDPTLRDRLMRAGAAWLIGWSALLAAIEWLPRFHG